ncbi:hypothetical protein [Rhizobium leguminosarum]|uniref:hypothetical protein n=1 Tax=Rhizobium leguminosarum TaxID=384 RepID=UPI001249C2AA|nr:hypothetical protein [Rhizobium leguminosarum]
MRALVIMFAVAAGLSSCAKTTPEAGDLSQASEMVAFDTKFSCAQSIEPRQACLVSRIVSFLNKFDEAR